VDISTAFLLQLALKMAVAAGIIVIVTVLSERTTPLVAAMIATLPVSAGPTFGFLAWQEDDAFIAATMRGSLDSNLSTAMFCLAYCLLARRLAMPLALLLSAMVWALTLYSIKRLGLSLTGNLVLSAFAFPLLHLAVRPYFAARPKTPPPLEWYDLPMRALAVALVVAGVTSFARMLGPDLSGSMATYPIVLSSIAFFVQPRIGGPAAGAIIASGILGLFGFQFALLFTHLAAVPMGRWLALATGLAICVLWNLALTQLKRKPQA
jgi:uncharacterized membrane protein (GlpM family)